MIFYHCPLQADVCQVRPQVNPFVFTQNTQRQGDQGPQVNRVVSAAIMFTTLADIGFAAMDWAEMNTIGLDMLWIASYITFAIAALYQKKLHDSFM